VIVARANSAFPALLTIPVIAPEIGALAAQNAAKKKQQSPWENSHWIRLEDTALKSPLRRGWISETHRRARTDSDESDWKY